MSKNLWLSFCTGRKRYEITYCIKPNLLKSAMKSVNFSMAPFFCDMTVPSKSNVPSL